MNAPKSGERSAASDAALESPLEINDGPEGLKQRSVRGSFATVLSQGAKVVIQLSSQIILARLLFPAEFGILAMAYPVLAFVQVFNDIGLGQAIVQRPTLVSAQVSALFWVNVAIGSALACLIAMAAPVIGWMYGEPHVVLPLIVLGLTLPVTAMSVSPNALLARHMQFGLMARNDVLSILAGAIVTVASAWQGFSYWSLVVGQFATAIAANVLAWSSGKWRPSAPAFNASVLSDVKFGGNITLSNLAGFMTTWGANLIVGLTAGKVSLGLYDRSYYLVVRPIVQMMAPLTRVAVPLLSRLAGQPEEYRSAYLQMFRTATLLIVPGMLVCITNGATLIHILLGPRWSAAAPIFSWICVGGLTSGIYQSAFWLFISQDRSRELRNFAGTAAVINIASYLVGALWGVVGVAAAASLGFLLITTPLVLFGASRSGPVRAADIIRCATPFVAVGVVVYGVLLLDRAWLGLGGILQIAVATSLSYGLFVCLSLASKPNRQLMAGAFRSLRAMLPG